MYEIGVVPEALAIGRGMMRPERPMRRLGFWGRGS